MDTLKVSNRLYLLVGIAVIAFTSLLLVLQLGMQYLGDLQDTGYKRSMDNAEMQLTAKIGPVLYRVIADSIINRNLADSDRDWKEAKTNAENLLQRSAQMASTSEEKSEAARALIAYRDLVSIYEKKVIPLLRANADLKEIRPLDDEMDKQVQAINDALTPLAKSLADEAAAADVQFDSTRSRIMATSLTGSLLMLGVLVLVAWQVSRSILRQLGGEPGYAMEVAHQISAGDLTTEVRCETGNTASVLGSMKTMQEQLAQMIRKIHFNAGSVSLSATELSAACVQVSSSSARQSEDTGSVAAAIEQLTANIEVVAGNASAAEAIATDSGLRSDQGATQVRDATDEMSRIARSVNETAAQMATLTEQSQQIGSIANVIKEVADQTNLLALNAAIEAARAGEQGRGFAVVADEVRKLAERTTTSAQEITTMISSIQDHTNKATSTMRVGNQRVSEGVALAERAGESMRHISEGSKGVVLAVGDISTALTEQKSTSGEISRRVENIAHMTEENAAAITHVAETAGQLQSLADDLKQAVSGFRV